MSSNTDNLPVTVVVAEDDTSVRLLAADALADAGFAVIEVSDATEALIILESKAAEIHILFTDIQMPGVMNGLELAHHTCGHWPWIAVLVTSGRSSPPATELPHGTRFLSKPYHPDHMVTYVRALAIGG